MSASERKKVDKYLLNNNKNELSLTKVIKENAEEMKIPIPHHTQLYCFKCFVEFKHYKEVTII